MTQTTSSIKDYAQAIEQKLDALLQPLDVPHSKLIEASRYAVLGGGKRLRPILALLTAEAFGVDPTHAIQSACSLEMIHGYSLIHDDLPCMDDDDYRRGKLTVHKVYGEGIAVLAGDNLLTYAFENLANDPFLSPEQKIELVGILSRKSGAFGMIGGQVLDIESEGKGLDLDAVNLIHTCKTGALIAASVEFGCVIGNAEPVHRKKLVGFAEKIGLAFQVVDDVIDVTASEAKHGTKSSTDVSNDKNTYVSLLGVEKSRAVAKELTDGALQLLEELPFDTRRIEEVALRMAKREI